MIITLKNILPFLIFISLFTLLNADNDVSDIATKKSANVDAGNEVAGTKGRNYYLDYTYNF